MILHKAKIKIKVPHRISGFFEIVDNLNGIKINDPEKIGSRGAGFNLNSFGITEVSMEQNPDFSDSSCQIYINNERLNDKAETTWFIFNFLKEHFNKKIKVRISHDFDLPVGCGFGASGSGALGTVYGMDYLMDLGLSAYEKGRIAHIAEVINKTGLGTICGQLAGGLCMLKEPGYPCIYDKIKIPSDIRIICGTIGVIPTKSILSDPLLSMKIKKAGRKALLKLKENPNIKNFISISQSFVKETEMLKILNLDTVEELMRDLSRMDIIGASMNQLGNSVFAICKLKDSKKVLEVYKNYQPNIKIFNSSIYEGKTITVDKN